MLKVIDKTAKLLTATCLFSLLLDITEDDIDSFESLDLNNALSALALAQQDIIELKSKVNALELTSFLILE